MRWFFLLALCCFSFFGPLHSGIESSFSQCKHKKHLNFVEGVDFMYMINLKKNIDTFRSHKTEFNKYDIIPYRYNAQDPSLLSYKKALNLGVRGSSKCSNFDALVVKRDLVKWFFSHKIIRPKFTPALMTNEDKTYFHPCMNKESISRDLDYLSIISDAYKSKYKVVWVMDDAVKIASDPNRIEGYLLDLQSIDRRWDVLYTDPLEQTESWPTGAETNMISRPDVKLNYDKPEFDHETGLHISEKILQIYTRSKAESFLISKHGMKKILTYYHKNHFFIPFATELPLIPGIKAYATNEPIVTSSSW